MVWNIVYAFLIERRNEVLDVGSDWLGRKCVSYKEYTEFIAYPGNKFDEFGLVLFLVAR